jgi:hypothetical protein
MLTCTLYLVLQVAVLMLMTASSAADPCCTGGWLDMPQRGMAAVVVACPPGDPLPAVRSCRGTRPSAPAWMMHGTTTEMNKICRRGILVAAEDN